MPECIYCQTELELDDHIDADIDCDEVRSKAVGHCPKCGKDFMWYEIYRFEKITDLSEC